MFKIISKLGGPILLAFFLVITACSPQNKNNNPTQSPSQEATSEQAAPTHESGLIVLSPFPTNTQEANVTPEATSGTPDANSPTGAPTTSSNGVPTLPATTSVVAGSGTPAAAATAPPSSSGSSPVEKYKIISQNPLDGIQVRPGVTIVTTWAVENIGPAAWTTDDVMRYFSGPQGDSNVIKFPKTVPPNTIVNLTVNIVAPKTLGDTMSWWKLTNAQGVNFGDVSLSFTVTNTPKNGTSATPSS